MLQALLNTPGASEGHRVKAGTTGCKVITPVLSLLSGRTLPSGEPSLPLNELIMTLCIHTVQCFGNCDA